MSKSNWSNCDDDNDNEDEVEIQKVMSYTIFHFCSFQPAAVFQRRLSQVGKKLIPHLFVNSKKWDNVSSCDKW